MGKRILITDDAAFMRMMLKDILSKNGYEIAGEAENGKVAIEKYNELKPDLVTLDIAIDANSTNNASNSDNTLSIIQWQIVNHGDFNYDSTLPVLK